MFRSEDDQTSMQTTSNYEYNIRGDRLLKWESLNMTEFNFLPSISISTIQDTAESSPILD